MDYQIQNCTLLETYENDYMIINFYMYHEQSLTHVSQYTTFNLIHHICQMLTYEYLPRLHFCVEYAKNIRKNINTCYSIFNFICMLCAVHNINIKNKKKIKLFKKHQIIEYTTEQLPDLLYTHTKKNQLQH